MLFQGFSKSYFMLYYISLLSKIIHIHRLWTDTYLILHDAIRVQKFGLSVPAHAVQNRRQ